VLVKPEREERVGVVEVRGAKENYGGWLGQKPFLSVCFHFDSSIILTPALFQIQLQG